MCRSPIGTFLLATGDNLAKVKTPLVQTSMILRILRYISPEPWGSLPAQAGRRLESLQRITKRVFTPWCELPPAEQAALTAGAQVVWRPVRIGTDGRLRHFEDTQVPVRSNERVGWLASRAPPEKHVALHLRVDVTSELLDVLGKRAENPLEYLWDCRFVVRFHVHRAPDCLLERLRGKGQSAPRIIIEPHGRFCWPSVWLYANDQERETLKHIDRSPLRWLPPPAEWFTPPQDDSNHWIEFEYIRPMDDV
jgi:tRNA(Ile)-lysidine synthase